MSKQEDTAQHTSSNGEEASAGAGSAQDLQAKLDEANDSLMRLQAEFANYKKRTEQEKLEMYNRAASDIFASLVNVLDDFELALSHEQDGEHFRKGMELVYAKLYQMAEDNGLKRIKTLGEQFDPTRHEAMLAQESDRPSQEVIEELQPGYEIDGTVVRTAKVKVSK